MALSLRCHRLSIKFKTLMHSAFFFFGVFLGVTSAGQADPGTPTGGLLRQWTRQTRQPAGRCAIHKQFIQFAPYMVQVLDKHGFHV